MLFKRPHYNNETTVILNTVVYKIPYFDWRKVESPNEICFPNVPRFHINCLITIRDVIEGIGLELWPSDRSKLLIQKE